MKIRFGLFLIVTPLIFAGLGCSNPSDQVELSQAPEQAEPEQKEDVLSGTISGLEINNIVTSQLDLVEGIEVIVSRVDIPPNTTLPKHWHPGEEFIYFMEGSGVMWQKDKADTQVEKGDVFQVPLKQIHTLTTGESGARVVVFRVHETGQPVRVNVEE
ncbi:MAG: cupin domain-containing protein [Leptolyngbyaceae cyanobacterium MO_188.B28]|nr:cupin domain-containing protein [Leptolyngbyaceae cyanobacterium MO_188.B28]